jgi:DNA-binding beta-propeller fold protein YncE
VAEGLLERTRMGLRNRLTRRRLGTMAASALAAMGIAASRSGLVYVSDTGRILDHDRVKVYANNGSPQGQFGTRGTGDGQFPGVRGIAVDSLGNISVADRGNWRIVTFRSDGGFLDAWGSRGGEPGQFSEMEGLAIDGDDRLYLADRVNKCMLKFDTDGTLLNVISGSAFFGPFGVAADRNGNVFVADGANGNEHIMTFAIGD